MSRGDGAVPENPGGDDNTRDESAPDDNDAASDVEHVRVRRARPAAGAVFGETPIVGPRPTLPNKDDDEPEQPATMDDIAAWVRHAALVAALRSGAQACVAGVFMGVVLGFFLSGLVPGVALLLGLALSIGAVPISIFAGFATYRQTLESERLRQGLCPNCGYDLRGLNTARCPECGTKLRPPKAWLAESDRVGEDEDTS